MAMLAPMVPVAPMVLLAPMGRVVQVVLLAPMGRVVQVVLLAPMVRVVQVVRRVSTTLSPTGSRVARPLARSMMTAVKLAIFLALLMNASWRVRLSWTDVMLELSLGGHAFLRTYVIPWIFARFRKVAPIHGSPEPTVGHAQIYGSPDLIVGHAPSAFQARIAIRIPLAPETGLVETVIAVVQGASTSVWRTMGSVDRFRVKRTLVVDLLDVATGRMEQVRETSSVTQ